MKFLLEFLTAVFHVGVFVRNSMYEFGLLRSTKLPGMVISIGNIAAGGTGKSPVVMDLATDLQAKGFSPAIVTRGYRSGLTTSEYQILLAGRVIDGCNRPDVRADEALMQSSRLPSIPVIIGARRLQAVRRFEAKFPTTKVTHWLIDDGFQHRKIHRDMDVVIIDGRNPWGKLLPAGMFREGVHSLKRADSVVITKTEDPIELSRVEESLGGFTSEKTITTCARFVPTAPKLMTENPPLANGRRWLLVAGIAHPEDFECFARGLDIEIVGTLFAEDHQSANFTKVMEMQGSFDAILTTEKDWARDEVRFKDLAVPVYVLPLTVNWLGLHPLAGI